MSTELGSDGFPLFEPCIVWTKPMRSISDDEPGARLLGRVSILGADFHVEAVEVKETDEGEQVAAFDGDQCEGWLDEVLTIVQGAAMTITINGRDYVLSITPYQQ